MTRRIAARLAVVARPGDVVALYGSLGVGKTVFVQGFARALGIKTPLRSPTFVLIATHRTARTKIKWLHHVDLYRLRTLSAQDRAALVEAVGDPSAITIIEWANRARGVFPPHTTRLHIAVRAASVRRLTITGVRSRLAALERQARHPS